MPLYSRNHGLMHRRLTLQWLSFYNIIAILSTGKGQQRTDIRKTAKPHVLSLWGCISMQLEAQFRFIWLGSFRGEDILDIDQSEARIACGGHVC